MINAPLSYLYGAGERAYPVVWLTWGVLAISLAVTVLIAVLLTWGLLRYREAAVTGFNIAFFPMHVIGLLGMPRRIYTYGEGFGWTGLNLVISLGAFLFAVGFLLLLVNVLVSLRRGAVAGPDPWGAFTLEWAVPSPPPPYNFAVLPTVASHHHVLEVGEGRTRFLALAGMVFSGGFFIGAVFDIIALFMVPLCGN